MQDAFVPDQPGLRAGQVRAESWNGERRWGFKLN